MSDTHSTIVAQYVDNVLTKHPEILSGIFTVYAKEHTDQLIEAAATAICDLNASFVNAITGENNSTALPWAQMPETARMGMIAAVTACLRNPAATPQEQHDRWMAARTADGWTYGPVASRENKTHPNLVPWNELSQVEQFKDAIFCTVLLQALSALQ